MTSLVDFGVRGRLDRDETAKVVRRSRADTITSLQRAAAYIRGIVRRSISKKAKVGPPGKPPHSPTGRLKASIRYAVERTAGVAVIGPSRAAIALIGQTHEFGGVEPPRRPTRDSIYANIRVGGVGPIAIRGRKNLRRVKAVRRGNSAALKRTLGRLVWVELDTAAQVERSKRLLEQLELPPSRTGAPSRAVRRYPPRPFMGPALQRSRDRLPAFWRNYLRGN